MSVRTTAQKYLMTVWKLILQSRLPHIYVPIPLKRVAVETAISVVMAATMNGTVRVGEPARVWSIASILGAREEDKPHDGEKLIEWMKRVLPRRKDETVTEWIERVTPILMAILALTKEYPPELEELLELPIAFEAI